MVEYFISERYVFFLLVPLMSLLLYHKTDVFCSLYIFIVSVCTTVYVSQSPRVVF